MALRLSEGLGVNSSQHPWWQLIQHLAKRWQQRFKVLNPILARNQYYYCQWQFCKVLLELKISICGDEGIKFRCCQRQQLAIFDA